MTGYLTVTTKPKGGLYFLCIPNKEIKQIFKSQVIEWFTETISTQSDKLEELYTAFENGDSESITNILDEKLLDTISFYDSNEAFYHVFLLALLTTCSDWTATSNRESGIGRSDIVVMRKDRKLGFVVEVKNVKDHDKLEIYSEIAVKQIETKDYPELLRRYRVKDI